MNARRAFRLFSLRRCAADEQGLVFVEFALIAPIMLLFLLGGFEISRFLLINQKLEKINTTTADVIAQLEAPQTTTFQQVLGAVPQMMAPYSFTTNGRVIITSVAQVAAPPASPVVRWQYCNGGGTMSATSRVGTGSGNATLPTGFTLAEGEDIIVTETYYNYAPIALSAVAPRGILYKIAVFKPRLGALSTFTSTCP